MYIVLRESITGNAEDSDTTNVKQYAAQICTSVVSGVINDLANLLKAFYS